MRQVHRRLPGEVAFDFEILGERAFVGVEAAMDGSCDPVTDFPVAGGLASDGFYDAAVVASDDAVRWADEVDVADVSWVL
jgi:hypothetical protein